MRKFIFILPIMLLLGNILAAQVVTSQENNEAYLKEFDMYSFKDAGAKIKDSTILFQHLIGVKYGYSISSVLFSHTKVHKQITSAENYGVYYTYLHSLLGTMPYFGVQIGVAKTDLGYIHVTEYDDNTTEEQKQLYNAIEVPFTALFRGETQRIRITLGIGGWGYYIYGTNLPDGIPSTTKPAGFGLIGNVGFALKLHPFEFHFEGGYKYGLTEFLDPKMYSDEYWIYSHPTQLQFSAGLFFNFGSKHYKKRK